ncbi:hypothetical protein OH76DRAFT_1483764 [Lentinus brumalis]|uniref:Uncharacterized protein n=1 Tax=Lentinus brumalis TaxID=2498619 RepID=A0A371D831_9APHY|nr:hypothetical protein OH76DRAFT_1483764 [Polyporus brumalis]
MARLTFPPPFTYAVIRMDPVTMVKDLGLDDPATLAEVEGMSPKKYLVYIEWPGELPMPDSRWCKYDINPIGTTLRPADERNGITPDMVLPISPNAKHEHGPEPVQPTPSFPFSNCYHWYFNTLRARVRVHKEGYDQSSSIFMSSLAVNRRFEDAYHRSIALLNKRGETSTSDTPATSSLSTSDLDLNSCEMQTISELYRRLAVKHGLLTSMSPGDGALDSDDDSDSDDLFGWDPDPATALLPLVDAWLEIEQHLSEDEIPSPVDFDAEIREVVAIIKRGLLRYASKGRAVSAASPSIRGGSSEDAPPPHSDSNSAGEDQGWRLAAESYEAFALNDWPRPE